MRDSESNEDSHNDVVVNFIEGFRLVSQEVEDCLRLLRIVGVLEDKVNDGNKGMRAGSSWNSILSRIVIFLNVVQETINALGSSENKSFKTFIQKFC